MIDADVGIIGLENSLKTCFINAIEAMFALMADLTNAQSNRSVIVEFEETDRELAIII